MFLYMVMQLPLFDPHLYQICLIQEETEADIRKVRHSRNIKATPLQTSYMGEAKSRLDKVFVISKFVVFQHFKIV